MITIKLIILTINHMRMTIILSPYKGTVLQDLIQNLKKFKRKVKTKKNNLKI